MEIKYCKLEMGGLSYVKADPSPPKKAVTRKEKNKENRNVLCKVFSLKDSIFNRN